MNSIRKIIIALILFSIFPIESNAQLDSVMSSCRTMIDRNYISDGQQYMSLITDDQTAEFSAIFYGGNTYRIIICGGNKTSELMFALYDKYRNELFNSGDFNYTKYWDFQFESTIECLIEAKFIKSMNNSGFAVILIGLKN
jgi:hypothetical protein